MEQSLEVLRLTEGAWTIVHVLAGAEAVHPEPFETIEFDLAAL